MEPIPAAIALLAAAGGGAGLTKLRLSNRMDERYAVIVLREVLEEVRQEVTDKQKEWEILLEMKQEELEALRRRLDAATKTLEGIILGDGPSHLS